jgi:hypothetical protein
MSPATVLFLAFVFRLIWGNILVFSNSQSPQGLAASAALFKKKCHTETTVSSRVEKNSLVVEICEEKTDNEEDISRANAPALVSVLCIFLTHHIGDILPDHSYDRTNFALHPKRYLALSILRI